METKHTPGPKDYATKAAQIWETFTDDERLGVRFGMLPIEKVIQAKADGFDDGRALTSALLAVAKAVV